MSTVCGSKFSRVRVGADVGDLGNAELGWAGWSVNGAKFKIGCKG